MEITWQIWQKVLLGVSITGSAAIVCILLAYCFIKCKRFKCSKKDLHEVVVIQNKNEVTDKDQNDNFTNKLLILLIVIQLIHNIERIKNPF